MQPRFYKLVMRTIPEVIFAHRYQTERYDISISARERVMELSILECGRVEKRTEAGLLNLPTPALHLLSGLERVRMSSPESLHRHVTIAISGDFTIHEITGAQIARCYRAEFAGAQSDFFMAILPEACWDLAVVNGVGENIARILDARASGEHYRNLTVAGLLFQAFASLTQWSIRQTLEDGQAEIRYGDAVYCRRAVAYINAHLSEHIAVGEIAAQLDLSAGHLSRIFRQVTGQTLVEYVNRQKLSYVRELLETKNLSVAEAGRRAGFTDAKYVSRMYKRLFGESPKHAMRTEYIERTTD